MCSSFVNHSRFNNSHTIGRGLCDQPRESLKSPLWQSLRTLAFQFDSSNNLSLWICNYWYLEEPIREPIQQPNLCVELELSAHNQLIARLHTSTSKLNLSTPMLHFLAAWSSFWKNSGGDSVECPGFRILFARVAVRPLGREWAVPEENNFILGYPGFVHF